MAKQKMKNPGEKKIRATAAVIERDGRILVGLRMKNDTYGGYWEFPGGKIEPGETLSHI